MMGRKIILAIVNDDDKIIGKIPLETEWSSELEKLSRDIFGTDINETMIDALYDQVRKSINRRVIEELLKEIRK